MNESIATNKSLTRIPFKNVHGASAPPFAVLQIVGSLLEDGVAYLLCSQPSSTLTTEYAVNGASAVAAGAKGTCFRTGDVRVAFDSGTPAAGELWGVRAGQWTLSKGYPSLVAVHGIHDAANRIARGSRAPIRAVIGACISTLAPCSAGTPGIATATVQVDAGAGFAPSDPAMTFTAHNISTATIGSGVLTQFVESQGRWIAIASASSAELYRVQVPSPGVAANASINITLPDGRTVSVHNHSGINLATADKVYVGRDTWTNTYVGWKSGGEGDRERYLRATLTATLDHGDSSASIGSVTTLAGGSAGVSPTAAANLLRWAGSNGDTCVVLEDNTSGAPAYYLWSVAWDLVSRVNSVDYAPDDLTQSYTKQQFLGKEAGETAEPVNVWEATLKTGVTNVAYSPSSHQEVKIFGSFFNLPGVPSTETSSQVWAGTQCASQELAAPTLAQSTSTGGGYEESDSSAYYY